MQEVATGYGLIEGPLWDPDRGLYFTDVLNGGVRLLDRSDEITTVLERRRGIGGLARHADGGLVFGGRDISWSPLGGAAGQVLLSPTTIPGAIGFNDLTTDLAGRIYVGSLAFRVFGGEHPRPGHLHVIDLDGSAREISDGVMLTNGLGVSPDGRQLYHSDTGSHVVRVYDLAPDGSVGPWRPFAEIDGPDGLKVAADGSVWVADAHGGRVAVFNADGSHRQDIAAPLTMVTSLCFGGDDLCDLYIVTGSDHGPRENCGTIFRTRSEVPGLVLPPARVRLSA